MLTLALIFATFTALLHGYIFYLECPRFGSPQFCRVFGISAEQLPQVQAAFRNLGIYNLCFALWLGVGIITRLFANHPYTLGMAHGFLCATLVSIMIAGVFLFCTSRKRRAALIQATPAALALVCLLLA